MHDISKYIEIASAIIFTGLIGFIARHWWQMAHLEDQTDAKRQELAESQRLVEQLRTRLTYESKRVQP